MITPNGVETIPRTAGQRAATRARSASRIAIRRALLVRALGLLALLFLLADLIVQTLDSELEPQATIWPHFVRFLDLNSESSLPTWFSISLLSSAALLTAVIAAAAWSRRERFRWHWTLLAVLIVGFSVDEGAQIHDTPDGVPLRDIVGTSGVLYYAWVVPALISAVIVGLVFARFLFALPPQAKLFFILSAATFMAGAVGLEMVSGWYAERHPGPSLGYATLSSLEEFLEMCGVILLITGLLHYAAGRIGHTDIIWEPDDSSP
jgi:hypothetical protein